MRRLAAPVSIAALALLAGCQPFSLKGELDAARGKAVYLADRLLDEESALGEPIVLDPLPEAAPPTPTVAEAPAPPPAPAPAAIQVVAPQMETMGGMPAEARVALAQSGDGAGTPVYEQVDPTDGTTPQTAAGQGGY